MMKPNIHLSSVFPSSQAYESMKEHCGYSRTSIPQQQVRSVET